MGYTAIERVNARPECSTHESTRELAAQIGLLAGDTKHAIVYDRVIRKARALYPRIALGGGWLSAKATIKTPHGDEAVYCWTRTDNGHPCQGFWFLTNLVPN